MPKKMNVKIVVSDTTFVFKVKDKINGKGKCWESTKTYAQADLPAGDWRIGKPVGYIWRAGGNSNLLIQPDVDKRPIFGVKPGIGQDAGEYRGVVARAGKKFTAAAKAGRRKTKSQLVHYKLKYNGNELGQLSEYEPGVYWAYGPYAELYYEAGDGYYLEVSPFLPNGPYSGYRTASQGAIGSYGGNWEVST